MGQSILWSLGCDPKHTYLECHAIEINGPYLQVMHLGLKWKDANFQ